jgi:hypothetical protein
MIARQRCGGGHAGRRFLGYSSKAPLVRRCIVLGQTAGSGLRHYQPARGGAHRGCPEGRDLRQRQLSAAAVWPPRSRLTAIRQHADSSAGFLESGTGYPIKRPPTEAAAPSRSQVSPQSHVRQWSPPRLHYLRRPTRRRHGRFRGQCPDLSHSVRRHHHRIDNRAS